jgi:hypothetical protein
LLLQASITKGFGNPAFLLLLPNEKLFILFFPYKISKKMVLYDTPLHLQALRDFVLKKDSRIETIAAVSPPTPEDIAMVRSRAERIKDFMHRLSTPYAHRYHHGPRTETSQPRVPEYVPEPELVSA